MGNEGAPSGKEDNLGKKGKGILAQDFLKDVTESDATLYFLKLLTGQYDGKGKKLKAYEPKIPKNADQAVRDKIKKDDAVRDLILFAKTADAFVENLDVTARGREGGKITFTPDVAKSLKIVLPKMKELILFLESLSSLEEIDQRILSMAKENMTKMEIFLATL